MEFQQYSWYLKAVGLWNRQKWLSMGIGSVLKQSVAVGLCEI